MSEDNYTGSKPLKNMTDKAKDLYNAYVKGNETERKINIKMPNDSADLSDKSAAESDETNIINLEDNESLVSDLHEILAEKDAKIVELELRIANIESELAEKSELLVRKAAEFENYQKRTLKEKRELTQYANENLLKSFINIFDDFGNAMKAANDKSDLDILKKGVELIYQKFQKTLENEGIKQMDDTPGLPFDYNLHEAIMQMNSDIPIDHIVQTVQAGFMYGDRVLRHAKVITSAGESNANTNEADNPEELHE